MPADAHEPSIFCSDRFFAHAPAPGRARTKLPGERRRTAHEIWARRSGHFSMPATALHRSESYLSVPWHLSMPRVGPWKAPRHDPASRARRPLSHRSIFTLLRSFGSENFPELGPSARVRILGIRNHGFFTCTSGQRRPSSLHPCRGVWLQTGMRTVKYAGKSLTVFLRPPTTSASSESPTFIAGVTRFLKLLRMLLILSIILVERYYTGMWPLGKLNQKQPLM